MIVRTLEQASKTQRLVKSPEGNWQSVRMLLSDDDMGFSFHITTIFAGKSFYMQYQNHLESVYCISGEGQIEDLANGEAHVISPGTMYALDKHDKHVLSAREDLIMACVFNPPVTGQEVHNKDGSYELLEEQ